MRILGYTYINPEKGEVLAQVKKNHIENLPVIYNKEWEPTMLNFVSQLLTDKINGLDTLDLENKIDSIVFHIYGLTYDEVLIVDPQTPITRGEYETEGD